MNFVALLYLSLFSLSVYAIDDCQPLLSREILDVRKIDLDLWGRKTPVTILRGTNENAQIKSIIPDIAPSDLVIGFEAGHAYILYENGRYDGSVFDPMSILVMGNAKIRHTKLRLAGGIIVRLRGLDSDVQSRLKSFFELERREFAMTCATGVCSTLARAGVQNLNGLAPTFTGNSLLKRLITSEFRNPNKTLITKEIFFYNVDSIERHKLHDRLITMAYAIPSSAIALIFYLAN